MKKAILISFTILISICVISAQQIWKFDHKIQKNDYYRLSGKINDKYPIQMYLEKDTLLCGNPYDDDMNLTLKGWYYYEKIKTKIPLIGSCNKAEGREYVELFVPANPKDKINKSTCKLKDFSESFSNKKAFDLTNMEWKMKNSKVASKVKLKIDHESSPKTKLTIILQKKWN